MAAASAVNGGSGRRPTPSVDGTAVDDVCENREPDREAIDRASGKPDGLDEATNERSETAVL